MFNRHFYITILALLQIGAIANGARLIDGVIERVSDGDTVIFKPESRIDFDAFVEEYGDQNADAANGRLTIRLVGMDAPETHLPSPEGMVGQGEWGKDATEYMVRLVGKLPSKVTIESHGNDKYHRTLGRIIKNKKDLDLEMIRAGQAITYFVCGEPECDESYIQTQKVLPYVNACKEAQRAGRGLWDIGNPLKEMPFEFRLRMQNRLPEKYVGDIETRKYVAPAQYKKIPVCNRIFFMNEREAKNAGFSKSN